LRPPGRSRRGDRLPAVAAGQLHHRPAAACRRRHHAVSGAAAMFDMTAVRERRRRQFDALMAGHGLAAIVISSAEFFQFYANLAISTFYWERPFALVVPRQGAAFAIVNAVAENGVRMQLANGIPWVEDFAFYCEMPQVRAGAPLTGEFAGA